MTTVTTTSTSPVAPAPASGLAQLRPASVAYPRAFVALLHRDLHVLRKHWFLFFVRTIMQPLLLMFVFTYVFPKIGQGVGGGRGSAEFTTTLVAGVVGLAIVFQGIQAVALPLVQEFGYSKEIEDRVLAPLPTKMVGIQKIVTGMLQRPDRRRAGVPDRRHRAGHAGPPARSTGWCCSRWPRSPAGWPPPSAWCSAPGWRPRTCRTCSPWWCCRSRSSAPSTTRGRRWRPIRWLQIARAGQPARLHVRGVPRRAHDGRAPHEPVGGLRRPGGVRRRAHVGRRRRLQQAHDELRRL